MVSASFLLGIFQLIVLVYAVVIHELAHGYVARSLGDMTAERMGRLTLNPFSHMDWFGSVMLPLLLWLAGSPFLFGYAKPVPYDPDALRDRQWGPTKVAIAGPIANIVLATMAGFVIRQWGPAMPHLVVELIGYIVWINVVLALFNLMPIPPLDGHWFLMAVLPHRFYEFKVALYRFQWPLLILFLLFVFPMLTPLISATFTLLTGIRTF